MKNIPIIPIVLPLLICCYGCNGSHQQQKTDDAQAKTYCLSEALKTSSSLLDAPVAPVVEQLTLSGKVEYNENDLVSFRSLLFGVVEQVAFELGDQVKKGQVLAKIKSTEIQGLFQQRKSQQNQISLLEKLLHTKRDLLKDGMISEPEMLEVQHDLETARIELDRINQSLQLYHATGDGYFQILAPKNGYIIQKDLSPGQIITQDSEPLFSISNLQEVWVMVNVYASNLKYVHVGDQVKVRTIAYPDQIYSGKIDKMYNVFDPNEHVMKARVILENPNLRLMPGLMADIIIDKAQSSTEGTRVPNQALIFSNNEHYIVVYRDDCHMQVRKVTILASNEEHTYIAERLDAQEKVMGSNALLVFEQLRD